MKTGDRLGSVEPPFKSKYHFHWKLWMNQIHWNTIFTIIIHTVAIYSSFNKSILLPMSVYKIAEWLANSVDPNQTPRSVASDLGLHCL